METGFVDNKYRRIYTSLCERAKCRVLVGYSERHHIIPKCLGGNNTPDNIAKLLPREHFIAHMCLMRCTTGLVKRKMVYAAMRTVWSKTRNIRVNGRLYESLRREVAQNSSQLNRGRVPTTVTHGEYWQAKRGSFASEETRQKMRLAQQRRRANETTEVRQAIGDKLRGIRRSEVTRNRMSAAQMGNTKKHDWAERNPS